MKKLVLLSLVSAGLLLTQIPVVESDKNTFEVDTCDEVEKHQHVALAKDDTKLDFVVVEDKNVGSNYY